MLDNFEIGLYNLIRNGGSGKMEVGVEAVRYSNLFRVPLLAASNGGMVSETSREPKVPDAGKGSFPNLSSVDDSMEVE